MRGRRVAIYNREMIVLRYLYVVALIVWVGGLVAAGALVAPALFTVLPAEAGPEGRALAGAAFSAVLRRVLTVGEVAGVIMLVVMTILRLLGPKPLSYGIRAVLLVAMMGATALYRPRRPAASRGAAARDDPAVQRRRRRSASRPLRRPPSPVHDSW